jgi:hypothetical protein
VSATDAEHLRSKFLLDYILQHAKGDERPYLEVSIFGHPFRGLLDSGASHTLLGGGGWSILERSGVRLNKTKTQCTVANGAKCDCLGFVRAPVQLLDKVQVLDVLIVPDVPHDLILGIDFWKSMDIVPDLRQDVWRFSKDVESARVHSIQSRHALSSEQQHALERLVQSELHHTRPIGCTDVDQHHIELLPGTRPIKQRYYPVSPHKQKIIDEELRKMLELDVIEPSKSPWSSPVCLVKKKDDTYRFCVDFRQLNAVTKKDAYPLPYVSSILDRLRDAKYISSLDVKSAFWQVRLTPESREYTAFTVPGRGLYQFKRMPFGLTGAPATWQRIIDRVLGPELQPSVFVFLDDIIVVSQDFETHMNALETVLNRLRTAGLTVSAEKCQFCRPQLRYLGYVVDQYGLRPDPEKVQAILDVPRPANATEVRRFIGTASWYRRFVPNFSSIVAPLCRLTKKKIKFAWSDECETAFRNLRERLITAPILSCPDFDRQFVLQCDASAYGIGAVLSQKFDDGERAICYLSRSLTRQERNYSTTERECLAVIWAVEKLRHYLEGVHFVVVTDHHSLLWLNRLKDPQGRLARWALRLQPYDFELVHRKGKDHVIPDMLSRSVPVSVDSATAENFSNTTDRWYANLIGQVARFPDKFPSFRVESGVLLKYSKCKIPELCDEADSWKKVVPKDYRSEILKRFHDVPASDHVGIYKTFWKIRSLYFWPGMRADVVKYVRGCKICAQYKVERKAPAGLMGGRPSISSPWQMISLDYIGPFPRSAKGYTHTLVVTDHFSKYVVLFPVRNGSAKLLTQCVEEGIFLVYGAPKYLICDNGTQMRSKEFRKLCDDYQVTLSYTPLYYPRSDPTERVNATVKTMIATTVKHDHRRWADNLAAIGCAIRTSRHETTGYTPYFTNFGREHKLLGSEFDHPIPASDDNPDSTTRKRLVGFRKLYQDIAAKLKTAHERDKRVYDLRRRPVQYLVGQQVWRKDKSLSDATANYSAKLGPKYVGPFVISRKCGSWTYELADEHGNNKGIWHVQELKPVHPDYEPP